MLGKSRLLMVPSLRPNKCRISASNCLKGDPEVEISDVVFDVLMGLALQGVGRALKPFTESIAWELSGAAVRYASMRSNVRFAKVLAALMKSADTDKCSRIFEQEEMGPALRIRPSHIRKYNEAVREIVNEGVANRLETITGEEPRRLIEIRDRHATNLTSTVSLILEFPRSLGTFRFTRPKLFRLIRHPDLHRLMYPISQMRRANRSIIQP